MISLIPPPSRLFTPAKDQPDAQYRDDVRQYAAEQGIAEERAPAKEIKENKELA